MELPNNFLCEQKTFRIQPKGLLGPQGSCDFLLILILYPTSG